jgi:hypothetical protein
MAIEALAFLLANGETFILRGRKQEQNAKGEGDLFMKSR